MKHLDERIENMRYRAGRANEPYASRNDEWEYRENTHPQTVEYLLSGIQLRDAKVIELATSITELDGKYAVLFARQILEQYQPQ